MRTEQGPWAAFEPTEQEPWDAAKVAHLHRRAGFGATRADIARDLKDGPKASVDHFFQPRALTSDEQGILDSLKQGVLDAGDADRMKAWWLYRVLYDPDPLREKLTLFWHGHFATSNRKVNSIPLMLTQNELFRKHALGRFADLLGAVVGDGAMLVWLDGAGSKKEKPNENFGREFLELFTVGVGNYTEADLRGAARAFTGWSVEKGKGEFHAAAHDSGDKTFLKQTGAWTSADIVRITLEQPACTEFLCRKLYRFFVREDADPPPDLLRPLAEELRRHDYEVGRVVEVILRSRHFYDAAVRRQRIRSPVEFSAGLLRTLEVPRTDVRLLALALACDRQGQDLFHPPNVKGWDGGKTWLNSSTVLERGNWCNDVLWGNADFGLNPYDPISWARRHGVAPEDAAEVYLDLLLQDAGGARARDAILRAGRAGKPDDLRKALQLIVHCPEYQLA
jgi:uncharacterized protein (DUF1800 family)